MRTHEKKKKRSRLNAIDRLLIVFICAACAGGAFFLYRRYRSAVPQSNVQYTVCLTALDADVAEACGGWDALIPVNSRVTSANGTAALGSVAEVKVREHLTPTVTGGRVTFLPLPGRFDLYVTVRGKAILQDGDGVRVSGIRIAAGQKGDFCFGSFLAEGAVISVKLEGVS